MGTSEFYKNSALVPYLLVFWMITYSIKGQNLSLETELDMSQEFMYPAKGYIDDSALIQSQEYQGSQLMLNTNALALQSEISTETDETYDTNLIDQPLIQETLTKSELPVVIYTCFETDKVNTSTPHQVQWQHTNQRDQNTTKYIFSMICNQQDAKEIQKEGFRISSPQQTNQIFESNQYKQLKCFNQRIILTEQSLINQYIEQLSILSVFSPEQETLSYQISQIKDSDYVTIKVNNKSSDNANTDCLITQSMLDVLDSSVSLYGRMLIPEYATIIPVDPNWQTADPDLLTSTSSLIVNPITTDEPLTTSSSTEESSTTTQEPRTTLTPTETSTEYIPVSTAPPSTTTSTENPATISSTETPATSSSTENPNLSTSTQDPATSTSTSNPVASSSTSTPASTSTPVATNAASCSLQTAAINNIQYILGSGNKQYTFAPWIIGGDQLVCGRIQYQYLFASGTYQSEVTYSNSVNTPDLSILASYGPLAGQFHFLKIQGTYAYIVKEEQFRIQFISSSTQDCSTNQVQSSAIQNLSYNLGTTLQILSPNWSQLIRGCGSLVYYLKVNGLNWQTNYSYLVQSFNSNSGEITLFHNNITATASYSFQITANVNSLTASQVFTVTSVNPCPSIVIQTLTEQILSYEILGTLQQFHLEQYADTNVYQICGNLVHQVIIGSYDPANYQMYSGAALLGVITASPTKCNDEEALILRAEYSNYPQKFQQKILRVKFTCNCRSVALYPSPSFSIVYRLGDDSIATPFTPFTFSDTNCQATIRYSLYQLSGLPTFIDQQDFSIDGTTFLLTIIQSFNTAKIGSYGFNFEGRAVVQGTNFLQQNRFDLTILRGCQTALFARGTLFATTHYYQINDTALLLSFAEFLVTDPTDIACSGFTYSLHYYINGIETPLPAFITFDPISRLAQVYETNSTMVGTYNFILQAKMNTYIQDFYSFTLTITESCTPKAVIAPVQTLFNTYRVGDPALVIPILPFSADITCLGDTIAYDALQVSGSSSGSLFIAFKTDVRSLITQTVNPAYIGIYDYRIRASIIRNQTALVSGFLTFKIQVIDALAASNSAPYFLSTPIDIRLFYDESGDYSLPEIRDDQGDKVIITLSGAPSFVQLQDRSLKIKPSQKNIGDYPVQAMIMDMNPSQKSNLYKFKISIIDKDNDPLGFSPEAAQFFQMTGTEFTFNSMKIKKEKLIGKIQATVSNIDQQGNIMFVFDQKLLIPDTIEPMILMNAVKFTLKKTNGTQILINNKKTNRKLENITDLELIQNQNWNITKFSGNQMQVQIKFPDPNIVSDSSVSYFVFIGLQKYDKIHVRFSERFFFISDDMTKIIDPNYSLVHDIPPQLQDSAATQALATMAGGAGSALTGAISTNIFLSVILGMSMKKLWLMITTLQIMTNLPLLQIYIPPNAVMCFTSIVDVANMNIIPKAYIDMIINVFVSDDSDESAKPEGLVFIVLMGAVLLGLFVLLLKYLIGRCAWQALILVNAYSVRKLYETLSKILFFNLYLTSTMKGYLNFAIATLLGLKALNFDDMINLFSTVAMAFYVISMPLFAFFLLRQNFVQLKSEAFFGRFGSLYQNLKPDEFSAVFQVVLFFIRRLVYSFSICFFGPAPFIQAVIQVLSSMFLICYTIQYRPYLKRNIFYFELFNELTLLSCSYFLIVFCDILLDFEMRYSVGWYMTAMTLFNILANWMNLVVTLVRQICKKLRRKCAQRKVAQKGAMKAEKYQPQIEEKEVDLEMQVQCFTHRNKLEMSRTIDFERTMNINGPNQISMSTSSALVCDSILPPPTKRGKKAQKSGKAKNKTTRDDKELKFKKQKKKAKK